MKNLRKLIVAACCRYTGESVEMLRTRMALNLFLTRSAWRAYWRTLFVR